MNKKNEAGQIIVIIMAILIMFSILIPVHVYLLTQESRWTQKEKRSTNAFHAAEQGTDRGIWKLQEKTDYWSQLGTGIRIAGYNNDVVYIDTATNSQYVVEITTTSNIKERKIVAISRDNSRNEVRAIEIIYTKDTIQSAIHAKGMATWGNEQAHWGPITVTTNIDAQSDAFPIKRSRLTIDGSGAVCRHSNHNLGRPDTTPPSSNSISFCTHPWYPPGWYEWQNFDTDVTDPTVDLPALKAKAIAQGRYYTTNQNWANTDDGAGPAGVSYATYIASYYQPDIVRYFQNCNLKLTGNKYLEGTLVVVGGTLQITGTNKGDYYWPVPPDAWKQYCAINTAAAGEWPGDAAGMPTPTSAPQLNEIRFNSVGGVTFHGVIYAQNSTVDYTGNPVIHGTIIVVNGGFNSGGNTKVFYDPDVANYAGFTGPMKFSSWREVMLPWPSGL